MERESQMNLTTHIVVAFGLGIAFFHNVGIAFTFAIGAMIPDLDREYLFVAKDFIGRHQLHRSLFHNFLFIGLLYVANPFLGFGALSHSLLDSFTSATDRGVELLFPFNRIIKGFKYNIEGDEENTSKKTQWWVEDPWTLLEKTTDRDLREPTHQPWRRSYGPFRNSRVVDWGIFIGSLVFVSILFATSKASLFSLTGFNAWLILSLAGIGIFYALGEYYRRRLLQSKKLGLPVETNWGVLAFLLAGIAIFLFGGYEGHLLQPRVPDLTFAAYALVSLIIGLAVSYLALRKSKTRDLSM
jgi:hypothetical protein